MNFLIFFSYFFISARGKTKTIVCHENEVCDDILCTSEICEYFWVIDERHSMTWRTKDHRDGRNKEFAIKYNGTLDQLQVKVTQDLDKFLI